MVGLAGLFFLVWKQHGSMMIEPRPSFEGISAVLPGALVLEAIPVIFLAWIYGSCGVGRDLGERSGSYLFSKPVSRAFFVWRDWGFGLAQLLVIVIGVNMVVGFELFRLLVSFGDPYHGSFLLSGRPVGRHRQPQLPRCISSGGAGPWPHLFFDCADPECQGRDAWSGRSGCVHRCQGSDRALLAGDHAAEFDSDRVCSNSATDYGIR